VSPDHAPHAAVQAHSPEHGIVNFVGGLSNSRLVCDTHRMRTLSTSRYKHHRFPAELSSPEVWLYCRFCLSDRDVEEL
jgi:hypothetical protein